MKLYYFNSYGRAEVIRLLLDYAKAEYEDIRYTKEEWAEVKNDSEKFRYGQVPVLEKDGKFYCQTIAILRFLGREYGYYPTDPELVYQHEKVMDICTDFLIPLIKVFFMESPEEKQKAFGELIATHFPKFFGYFEDHLKENSSKDYMIGDSITVVDFAILNLIYENAYNEKTKDFVMPVLENYPTLKAYLETRIEAQKEYFDSRPKCDH